MRTWKGEEDEMLQGASCDCASAVTHIECLSCETCRLLKQDQTLIRSWRSA